MNVLVTTDGSAPSLLTIPHGAALATATGSGLVLARVLDPRTDVGGVLALKLEEAVAVTASAWEAELRDTLIEAHVDGVPLVARKGRDEELRTAILRVAAEQDASVIAMATRGAGRLRHALIGSVAMDIIGQSELPVMVTGPAIQPPAGGNYRVIATTDGSEASRAVVRALAPVFANPEIEITLLRLSWPGDAEDHAACEAQLHALRAELPAAQRVNEVVREVPMVEGVANAIADAAKDLGASAIAMATHGHGAAYHMFAGSVALSVVQNSPLPVILARSPSARR